MIISIFTSTRTCGWRPDELHKKGPRQLYGKGHSRHTEDAGVQPPVISILNKPLTEVGRLPQGIGGNFLGELIDARTI